MSARFSPFMVASGLHHPYTQHFQKKVIFSLKVLDLHRPVLNDMKQIHNIVKKKTVYKPVVVDGPMNKKANAFIIGRM